MNESTITTEETEVLESNLERQGANARASWRFSGDHIQQALAHCTPERKETLIWCFNWCISRSIWFADFAKQVGYAENTLYKIYTGRHVDPNGGGQYDVPEKLHQAAQEFRKLEIRKAKLGETEFINTPTARRIWNGCDLARESRTPVFIYGASHLGKTWAHRFVLFLHPTEERAEHARRRAAIGGPAGLAAGESLFYFVDPQDARGDEHRRTACCLE